MNGKLPSEKFRLKGIYVGWPKCGSTWLFKLLDAHPDVVVPQQKDSHYFDRFHDRGREWLASQFGVGAGTQHAGKVFVDIGHDYIFSELALARIGNEEPDATVFVGLRDPAQWILSEYAYVSGTGRVSVGFEQFVAEYEYALKYARYEVWIGNLMKHVRPENIRFLVLEDLAVRSGEYVRTVSEGLGVNPDVSEFFDINEVVNAKLAPRHNGLLTAVRAASSVGERIGLRKAIQVAKRSPLRGLVFKPVPKSTVDEERLAILQRRHRGQFAATIEAVSEITRRDLNSQWSGAEC